MLKIKSVLLGLITSICLFFLLIFAEAVFTDKLAKMNEPLLSNFAYIFMLLSVFAGGLIAAVSARGRGLIYGALIAAVWIVLSFLVSLILGAKDLIPVLIRAVGLLPAGVIGGGAGILLINKNEYM